MEKLTVIGVGNRLRGDDGAGPRVIDRLRPYAESCLELVDAGTDALGILEYLNNRQHVRIVDACLMNGRPGDVVRFAPEQAELMLDQQPQSLHGIGLSEVLKMAKALEMLPEDIKILGLEPESVEFEETISAAVNDAIDRACKEIRQELKEFQVFQ